MDLKIFSGRSNEPLAQKIVDYLAARHCEYFEQAIKLGSLDEKRGFSDGELYTRYGENIRGCDVFIVQSTNQPHENDEELRIMVDTAKLASAGRITAVIPYFGYARQDRKDKSRAPVSAVRKVKELAVCGVDRLLVLDVHSSAVEIAAAAINIPCDHLWARPVFIRHMADNQEFVEFLNSGVVIAGPDLNAGKFVRGYAEAIWKEFDINIPIALIEKRRDPSTGETEILNVIGDVSGKNVLLIDDMIDTGGTTCDAACAFKDEGAGKIWALATHGLFSGRALTAINKSPIEKVFTSDSICNVNLPKKSIVVSAASLLSEAIFCIHTNQSVSSLFD